jgi:hypothetical protein
MRRFCEFGNKHRQKKCNHPIDTVAMSGDPALRDFFVNYEHSQKQSNNRGDLTGERARLGCRAHP